MSPTSFQTAPSRDIKLISQKRKADDRTRTDNLLITNQLLCQLSHIGVLNLIACRSKTLFSRSRCNRLYDENINLTLMQAFVRLMFPSCTQSLFRENWATSAHEFLSDSKGIWTPVTAVKGRCLNRLTMEPDIFVLGSRSEKRTPPVGLEPTTLRLTAACSTDWAKEDYLNI